MTNSFTQRRLPPLADYDRAREEIRRHGLEAVVCSLAHNVYYFSGLDSPPLWHFPGYAAVLVPAQGEPALICSILTLNAAAEMDPWISDVYLVSRGDAILYLAEELLESERYLRELRDTLAPTASPTLFEAIAKALTDRGLERGRIGFDEPGIAGRIPLEGFQPFDAVDVVRRIRMIKTAPEIEKMRKAAEVNEAAALEAVRLIPLRLRIDEIVARYRSAIALRGGEAKYLLTGSPHHTGTFQHQFTDYRPAPGDFLMVDALGTWQHYHGDFGRTVSWGVPAAKVRQRFEAMRRGFEAGYEKARPGVPFSEISETVRETVRREGFPEFVACAPHSVGLEHTDNPRSPMQTVQANMTMNIDIVYMEAGFGALHLEDTFLIREQGNELLTSGRTELIVVE
ncbi:MAG: Xaa-Pro peptidase family protein [Chloroflexota bacterium]|nr:Xaa-Pro peptidase family protein [Dehalococcoidia bacterium]MDW8253068.1 Xaa-Pro peptidase family protein [Chloroflexota bacterium]